MPDENDKYWDTEKGKLRRALDLYPLCQEESEKEYKRAKAEPLTDNDINAVLTFVRSMGERDGMVAGSAEEEEEDAPPEWVDPVDAGMMEEELMQLNRNAGVEDEGTKDLLDKHRREMLGDDTDDEDHGERGGEDAPGMADGEDPDGAGR